MKLKTTSKSMNYSLSMAGIFLALTSSATHAGAMGPMDVAPAYTAPGKMYIGVFGGYAASTHVDISQYGTALFPEMSGGPLAVNAFGSADRSAGFVGGHVGYQWAEIPTNSSLSLSPAVELEGYYLGKSSFQSHDINDNTNRLQEHDFLNTLPTSTGVFLINGILNFNPSQGKLHP